MNHYLPHFHDRGNLIWVLKVKTVIGKVRSTHQIDLTANSVLQHWVQHWVSQLGLLRGKVRFIQWMLEAHWQPLPKGGTRGRVDMQFLPTQANYSTDNMKKLQWAWDIIWQVITQHFCSPWMIEPENKIPPALGTSRTAGFVEF